MDKELILERIRQDSLLCPIFDPKQHDAVGVVIAVRESIQIRGKRVLLLCSVHDGIGKCVGSDQRSSAIKFADAPAFGVCIDRTKRLGLRTPWQKNFHIVRSPGSVHVEAGILNLSNFFSCLRVKYRDAGSKRAHAAAKYRRNE